MGSGAIFDSSYIMIYLGVAQSSAALRLWRRGGAARVFGRPQAAARRAMPGRRVRGLAGGAF
jgi:hypothetical protein